MNPLKNDYVGCGFSCHKAGPIRNHGEALAQPVTLSIVIPCYNEEKTLERCVERVLEIREDLLSLEIIIVDDCSQDQSYRVARSLADRYSEIVLLRHDRNRGKGAALRSGFSVAKGDYVAIQDADLEYEPRELKGLLIPIIRGEADVVFGSRFMTCGPHRVLYFWHSLANSFLTFMSNMFSDLNLTDMETCYKVFRRDVIEKIQIEEDRFGIEPELVAKVARMRLRVFEMGISYYARTYEEGKKIGLRDGFRALYCIFRYNAPSAPLPVQFMIYVGIGGIAALFNLFAFLALLTLGAGTSLSIAVAYLLAAAMNYFLCISLLFRHKARWSSATEVFIYLLVTSLVGVIDISITKSLLFTGLAPWLSKSLASLAALVINFMARRYLVFPEPSAGAWKPQMNPTNNDR